MLKSVFCAPKEPIQQIGGGDTKISIACGIPEVSVKGSSYLVSIFPERAEYGVKGYYHESAKFAKLIQKASDEKQEIMILTEKHRKKGVSNETPIETLTENMKEARNSIVHACVGVYDFNNSKWILDGNRTDPENYPGEVQQAIAQAKSAEVIDEEAFFQPPTPKLFIPNPAGWDEQQQMLTMYFFVTDCEKKYDYQLSEQHRKEFAKKALQVADEFQKLMKETNIVDYKDYSHTRARFLLFSCEQNLVPFDGEAVKDVQKWCREIYKRGKSLIEWIKEK